MFVRIYYKPSLFNAHTMILIVHIFMSANKLCLNPRDGTKLASVCWPRTASLVLTADSRRGADRHLFSLSVCCRERGSTHRGERERESTHREERERGSTHRVERERESSHRVERGVLTGL